MPKIRWIDKMRNLNVVKEAKTQTQFITCFRNTQWGFFFLTL